MDSKRINEWYRLTKPGIIYGNLISCAAGYTIVAGRNFILTRFLLILLSTSLIIASACVLNNILDRDIDLIMPRTKNRSIAINSIEIKDATTFAVILGTIGFSIIATNFSITTIVIGVIGFIDYVIFYSYFKRRSVHSTLVGTISGSAAIVAGYTAYTNHFDLFAGLLFLSMTAWQMPHFYAIAIYRRSEYLKAKLPLLSVIKGNKRTIFESIIYTDIYSLSIFGLYYFGYINSLFFITMSLISFAWIIYTVNGLSFEDKNYWARRNFKYSLYVLLAFSFLSYLRVFI
jgi:protoheme IX farnesyltransferase